MKGRLPNQLKARPHAQERDAFGATPLGLCSARGTVTQGSSFLATLGFEAESLRDSRLPVFHGDCFDVCDRLLTLAATVEGFNVLTI
jgi:hypothetical protein